MTSFSLPRGTKDILPNEISLWKEIEQKSSHLFETYNYSEIRTPIFEVTELFERGIGDETDIVEKEMYTFKDKKGRSLTLRPEGTAPIVRAAIQNNLIQLGNTQKLYYKGPYFRYERPQSGRYRQFHQMGVEYLGSSNPFVDAEVISMGVRLFDQLGLTNLSVSINSVGCSICRPVFEERLCQFIGANLKKLCEDCNKRYHNNPLRILDCKNKQCNTYFSGLPDIRESQCRECKDHFSMVVEHLDRMDVSSHINPRLVRGLDYYTRTTFEIISDDLGAQNAICGGGRYDTLIEQLGGPKTPAVGFAFGIERVVLSLKTIKEAKPKGLCALIAPLGSEQLTPCITLLDQLRQAGVPSDLSFDKEALKAHLKLANKLNAAYAVIIGEDEAEKNQATIKDLKTGEQVKIPFAKIVPYLDEKNTH